MRILYLYKDYFPVLGGIENHIRLCAEGLRQRGVDVRVLVTNTNPQTTQETISGVPVIKAGRSFNLSSAPVSFDFYAWLRKLLPEVDLVHLHLPYPPAEIGQMLFGSGKPFVITYHSDIVKQKLMGTFYAPILRQLLKRTRGIAASSPTYIRTSQFLQPIADRCQVIPYGIDLSRFAATDKVHAKAAEIRQRYAGKPLLLFVGQFRHYKGLNMLIEALPSIPDAHLLAVGNGPLGNEWKQLTQTRGLTERVSFLGELSGEDLVASYHAADLFVLPSVNRAEALGIVQIEAMTCRVPCISTELGTGTSWVNQHGVTGLVAPPSDPAALAEAIRQLLDDPVRRRQMGEAAYQRAHHEFSQEVMLDRLQAFYRAALHSTS